MARKRRRIDRFRVILGAYQLNALISCARRAQIE
jgi:hypothetical protein